VIELLDFVSKENLLQHTTSYITRYVSTHTGQ
jgi:hypothetical protein